MLSVAVPGTSSAEFHDGALTCELSSLRTAAFNLETADAAFTPTGEAKVKAAPIRSVGRTTAIRIARRRTEPLMSTPSALPPWGRQSRVFIRERSWNDIPDRST